MNDIKLAWDNDGTCYTSRLDFTIPGYTFNPVYSIAQISHPEHYNSDNGWYSMSDWTCQFYLEGENSSVVAALLDNYDFGIPDTDTAEEMMQAVERLSPDDFARALADNGYQPGAE